AAQCQRTSTITATRDMMRASSEDVTGRSPPKRPGGDSSRMVEQTTPSMDESRDPVGQQVSDGAVRPGTALERLIRDNQDQHMLRAEEVSDNIGLPVWLRLYWRKEHPEVE